MKKMKLTPRDYLMLTVLLVLLLGVCYYMLFYTPLQEQIRSLNMQTTETESNIMLAQTQLTSMTKMQNELEDLFDGSSDAITEIAPYDNAKVIMNELNGILKQTLNYKLSFTDPVIDEDGIVRRTVNMSFVCADYSSAKQVITNLCNSKWRCLMKNISMNGGEDISASEVSCNATIIFYESTNLE